MDARERIQRFREIRLVAEAELDRMELPLRDLLALRQGTVILLPRRPDGVTMRIAGAAVACGEVMSDSGRSLIRIRRIAPASPPRSGGAR